jgi:hypothetical protein
MALTGQLSRAARAEASSSPPAGWATTSAEASPQGEERGGQAGAKAAADANAGIYL